jgi:hypothetical protein
MFTKDIYLDEKAPAFALLFITIRKYGMDMLHYEPELVREEIEKDYGIKLPTINHDKLQAAIVILATETYENDWRVFETCNHLFNNSMIDHDVMHKLEAEEIIVGQAEVSLIRSEPIKYDDEIRAYAGIVFHDYGMHKAPKLFPQALMPDSVKCKDDEKNEALKELFDAHAHYILSYLEKIE